VGVFFVLLLLVIIVVTNVPLRGPWSIIVVLFVVALIILLAYVGVLEQVLTIFSWLDVRISLGGYVAISTTLFVLWLLVVMVFDRFNYYMVFKPGQLKVREGFWEGEKDYDTAGMTLEKQRTDLFRHWILGLGAGDLIIRTSGAQGHQHDFPNVLFVSRRAAEINEMMRERAVVSGQNV
jgi:energy-coupling factor transporter transmembrane protein EcfT